MAEKKVEVVPRERLFCPIFQLTGSTEKCPYSKEGSEDSRVLCSEADNDDGYCTFQVLQG